MITLIIIGASLYLYGYMRAFLLYVTILTSVCSLALVMAFGAGWSYLLWPETVQAFNAGEFWTNQFVARPGFTLVQAYMVPLIFVADMVRVTFRFVWQVPNVFSISALLGWLWAMNAIWGIILHAFVPARFFSK